MLRSFVCPGPIVLATVGLRLGPCRAFACRRAIASRLQRRHRTDVRFRRLIRRIHGGTVRYGLVIHRDRCRRDRRRAIRLFRGLGRGSTQHLHGGEPAPDLSALIGRTDAWSRSGAIDDTANIARQRIYLFNGYNDAIVRRPVSNALYAFYANYRPASLFYQTAVGAGHAQVTVAYGGGCADNGGEFINRCGYDQAGIILQHIYGALTPATAARSVVKSSRSGNANSQGRGGRSMTAWTTTGSPWYLPHAKRGNHAERTSRCTAACNPTPISPRTLFATPATTNGPTPIASSCSIRRSGQWV